MTRFMISLEEGVELVWKAFQDMCGGEIYVKKIPSMKIIDIANAINPNIEKKLVGIRPGEKLHEQMIGFEDSPYTYEYNSYYKIFPSIHNWSSDPSRIRDGKKVSENFDIPATIENIENPRTEQMNHYYNAKNTSLKDVIIEISKGQQGAVFVCENKKLLWVFTDGDLRRCIESGIQLATKVNDLKFSSPLTINSGSKVSIAVNIMKSNKI